MVARGCSAVMIVWSSGKLNMKDISSILFSSQTKTALYGHHWITVRVVGTTLVTVKVVRAAGCNVVVVVIVLTVIKSTL